MSFATSTHPGVSADVRTTETRPLDTLVTLTCCRISSYFILVSDFQTRILNSNPNDCLATRDFGCQRNPMITWRWQTLLPASYQTCSYGI
ncbi:hypothetical protein COCVIDRAFT_101837 [Bipolaris victoriae FI3]|uniref:Uncharacterized protein n=2 Tax=Bipolaris TaxID=33194 RepID=W6XTP0_COCC2|nr:uncharacterized protein COCCADRAFT_38859 [Bipolaris zeicola 26-R-13]XP_014555615.1 hypothetical protein COCVIDRAFT_101837 [Bipolaris victoriae FI3]EUC30977.1 hypothetical protein COCCADRAFT_38859 [Bipolaris zeicola 26-R-13]